MLFDPDMNHSHSRKAFFHDVLRRHTSGVESNLLTRQYAEGYAARVIGAAQQAQGGLARR